MASEIRPEVIKKTQSSLGRYIKKPPLTEKLLRKPPFRFLHDIISAVIKETGFLENLFTEEELNSDIRDKEAKVAYLTKLINVVRSELTVRPTKIIAGQEPTKTNELLQAIGKALDKKINSEEVVQHYKANLGKDSRNASQNKSAKHESLKTTAARRNGQTREVTQEYEKEPIKTLSQHERKSKKEIPDHRDVVNTKETGSTNKTHQTQKQKINDETVKHSKGSALVSRNKIQNQKGSALSSKPLSATQNDDVSLQSVQRSNSPLATEEKNSPFVTQNTSADDFVADKSSVIMEDNKVPESSEGNPDNSEGTTILTGENQHQERINVITQPSISDESVSISKDSARPITSRPSSARPAAPKLRWKSDFNVKSSELALLKNDAVIVENFDAVDDDTDSMVVMETEVNEYRAMGDGLQNLYDEGTQEHGYLVAQILQTQKELANVTTMDPISNKVDTEIERSSKKSMENFINEVEKLRSTIQTLTRDTHPMGKLLDFLQEDVESMQTELSEWRNQSAQLHNQLQVEKVEFQATTNPLEGSFDEIQVEINNRLDKIHQTKLNIVRNNHKIEQLLEGRA